MFGPINILKLPWRHIAKKGTVEHLRRESFTLTTNLLMTVTKSSYMPPLKTILKTILKTFLKTTLKMILKTSPKTIKI